MDKKVVLLFGPSGVGKTALTYALASKLPIHIVNADASQVYQGMDIGTDKPSIQHRSALPHALFDIVDPSYVYTAAKFNLDALAAIQKAWQDDCIPVVVGGSFLYIKVLLEGIADIPVPRSCVMQNLKEEAEAIGWESLYEQLKHVDAVAAANIHPHNHQRIMRALSVYLSTGKPISWWWQYEQKPSLASCLGCEVFPFALVPQERSDLHAALAERFQSMLNKGFVDEVRALKKRDDLHLGLPSMRAIGYRQIWQYLDGDYEYTEMYDRALKATQSLVKRQMTWFRKYRNSLHTLDLYKDDLSDKILLTLQK